MNIILTEFIVLLWTLATIFGQENLDFYQVIPENSVPKRPLPADLEGKFKNKTGHEMDMEDCMTDYVTCNRFNRETDKGHKICASNHHNPNQKHTFESYCEMRYESCKSKASKSGVEEWHFLNNGPCFDNIFAAL